MQPAFTSPALFDPTSPDSLLLHKCSDKNPSEHLAVKGIGALRPEFLQHRRRAMQKPGATPQVIIGKPIPSAVSAESISIPEISFVGVNSVGLQEFAVFVLKRDALMVPLLTVDISLQSRYV